MKEGECIVSTIQRLVVVWCDKQFFTSVDMKRIDWWHGLVVGPELGCAEEGVDNHKIDLALFAGPKTNWNT